MATEGLTGHDPIPVDVENALFFKEDYETVFVPAYEAPPQDEYPSRSLKIRDGSWTMEEVRNLWGKFVIDAREDIWRVVGYSYNDEDGRLIRLSLSVEKWWPEYTYETIRCGICQGQGTRVSRDDKKDVCPMIRWTQKDGKEVHTDCLTPHVPSKAITTPDGGIQLDMRGTMASLNQFHRECKAYADWFGFLDPNPVKYE